MMHQILKHPVFASIVVAASLLLLGVVLAIRRDAAEYQRHRDLQERWRSS